MCGFSFFVDLLDISHFCIIAITGVALVAERGIFCFINRISMGIWTGPQRSFPLALAICTSKVGP